MIENDRFTDSSIFTVEKKENSKDKESLLSQLKEKLSQLKDKVTE